jgi:hypothetical protein
MIVLILLISPVNLVAKITISYEKTPLPFIGPHVVLMRTVVNGSRSSEQKPKVYPEFQNKIIKVLQDSVILAQKFELPDKTILRKISISWHVMRFGTFRWDDKEIIVNQPWGKYVIKECKIGESLNISENNKLSTVSHEFAHAIFRQNLKRYGIDDKQFHTLISSYSELFADTFSVLLFKDLEVEKSCDNQRSFLAIKGGESLLEKKYEYRAHQKYRHILFDPIRLVIGELTFLGKYNSQDLLDIIFKSIVNSILIEIKQREEGKELDYFQKNDLLLDCIKEVFGPLN